MTAQTLVDLLERASDDDAPFLEVLGRPERARTLSGLWRGARRWARRLQDLGVGPGDRVAIAMESRPEAIEAAFGAWLRRAAVVPLPAAPGLRGAERQMARVGGILRASTPRVLLVRSTVLGALPPELLGALSIRAVPLESSGEETGEPLGCRPDDLALVQFTSGSTGQPRGVALAHHNLVTNVGNIVAALKLGPGDRTVSWLPLNHDMGLIGGVLCMIAGRTPVWLIVPEEFLVRPGTWLETISRVHGTFTLAPNFAYQLCLARVPEAALEKLELGQVRLALNGAEPVRAETMEAFVRRFGRCGFGREVFLPVYGLAESTLAAVFPAVGREPRLDRIDPEVLRRTGRAERPSAGEERVMVSVGRPFSDSELRVAGPGGAPLPERTEGEILLRGPSVMGGYLGNPEASAVALAGGWLHTGDLGYVTEGELFVTGRIKAVLIRGGEKHHAEDLERAAEQVADVRPGCCAAFAVDRPGGEEIVLVVERAARSAVPPAELGQAVAEQVARAEGMRPDRVLVVAPGSVPKTTSGKVERHQCRSLLEQGALAALGTT